MEQSTVILIGNEGRFTVTIHIELRCKYINSKYICLLYTVKKEKKKTAVTHTHNTEINYLYTRLLSYTNTFTQEKKNMA